MENETKLNGVSILLFRIMLSGIFVVAGISHLLHPHGVTQRITDAKNADFARLFGDPHALGIWSGYALILFGMTFLLGIYTRWSAVILFVMLIPITITIQMGNGWMHGPLWKNIAIFGALLFFIFNNIKQYSLYNK